MARSSFELVLQVRSDYDEHVRFVSEALRTSFVAAVCAFGTARQQGAAAASVDAATAFSHPIVRVVPAARIGKLAARTSVAVAEKCKAEAALASVTATIAAATSDDDSSRLHSASLNAYRTPREVALGVVRAPSTELDFLGAASNAQLRAFLPVASDMEVRVLFSSECEKRQIGTFGYTQTRHFIVTTKCVVNTRSFPINL